MRTWAVALCTWLPLVAVSTLLAVVVPFTKVEESFGIQAVHDVLMRGTNITEYDHLVFPGVVPRSFWPPLLLALLTWPVRAFAGVGGLQLQVAARVILGAVNCAALTYALLGARRTLARGAYPFVVALFCVQFHTLFYVTRTLPNTYGLHMYWLALGLAFRSRIVLAMLALAVCALVVRSDVLVFAVPLVAYWWLWQRRAPFWSTLAIGAVVSAGAVAASVLLDSMFWRRWVWPEGEVLFFNTVLNRSHEWGVMPVHWYFTSALPRMLLVALPLAALGAAKDARVRPLLLLTAVSVALYSALPHKEVRFIFPAALAFNIAAGAALHWLWGRRTRVWVRATTRVAVVLALAACAFVTLAVFMRAAAANYPGAHALLYAQQRGALEGRVVHVHLDAAACMAGVTQFLYAPADKFRYTKEDHPDRETADILLTGVPPAELGLPAYRLAGSSAAFGRFRRDLTIVEGDRIFVYTRDA